MDNSGKIPASVVIAAYNEEHRIAPCLDSVKDFDEVVVVVDLKTTDDTKGVALARGCRVFVEDWKGFGPLKQSGVDRCRNDFVLILDADERLPAEAAKDINDAVTRGGAEAYSLRRKNHIGNRWIKHCGWWPDRVVRLFDRRKCAVAGTVHESVAVTGRTRPLDALIEHYGSRGYSDIVEKMNRYSSIAAEDFHRRGKRAWALSPISHGFWRFFKSYVIQRGFMDGLDGLVLSVLNGGGAFFKYAKLLELQKSDRPRRG